MSTNTEAQENPSFYLNRCRVCLEKTDKFYPLVGQITNVETTISHMIESCASLEVEITDDLPNNVCIPCFRTVRIAYNFVKQYKESQKILLEERSKNKKSDLSKVKSNYKNARDILKTNESRSLETKTTTETQNIEMVNVKGHPVKVEFVQNTEHIQEIASEIKFEDPHVETDFIVEQEYEESEQTEMTDEHIFEYEETEHNEVDMAESAVEDTLEFEDMNQEDEQNDSTVEILLDESESGDPTQSGTIENILIVTENENESEVAKDESVDIPGDKKPKYILRRKIAMRFTCPKCPDSSFTGYDRGYRNHIIQMHTNEILNCNLCFKEDLNVIEFLKHFEETHRYQCPTCFKSFTKNNARVQHMKEHSNILVYKPGEISEQMMLENVGGEGTNETEKRGNYSHRKRFITQYVCPKCTEFKSFQNYEKGFLNHILLEHNYEIFDCQLCLKKNLNIDDYLRHFEEIHRYQCPICEKSFKRLSTKQVHMKTHSDVKYKCTYCAKSFYTSWFLKKHLNTHTETIKYTCDECGYSSATYDNYRYHLKKHQGPKHLCTYCGQSFLLSVHLKYHMWKHTGDKYFKCAMCPKSYTSASQLKKHKRRHHAEFFE